MEVERMKVVKVMNDVRGLIYKLANYNHSREEKDETYFWLDRLGVECKLIYCDLRDIVLSDALLRQKFIQQIGSKEHSEPVQPINSTILD